jgi:adenine-specific DNA-methyltransferase
LRVSKGTDAERKSQLGQYMTPERTARFMASLFVPTTRRGCRLLDPGAGIGSLSSAFLERCMSGGLQVETVHVTAFEQDLVLHQELKRTLSGFSGYPPCEFVVIGGDFIEQAVGRIQANQGMGFTHVILNPPYKKIASDSCHRRLLRRVGIEAVNQYSAFLALALDLLEPGGQLVAITPRSFCNGPYYRPFRKFILERGAIRHIHLFGSRNRAFRDDHVLQENVIVVVERDGRQSDVTVSASTDDSFADLTSLTWAFDQIVLPSDPDLVIRIPAPPNTSSTEVPSAVHYSLSDIGVEVSTGPVVDFRVQEHIRDPIEPGSVPLLYPGHFNRRRTIWPDGAVKKAGAILDSSETRKWLYPVGFYCVVRRFSSKEERRRIVASVVEPDAFPGAPMLGFENHLNVFHEHKRGLKPALAYGLAVFLSARVVDEDFRVFSGHTQVNATDLRSIKYPSRRALVALGEWAMGHGELTEDMIDRQVEGLAT